MKLGNCVKKMHALRFDYAEALRNPETDKKELIIAALNDLTQTK